MNESGEAEMKRMILAYRHTTRFTFGESLLAKRVRGKQAVVAAVKPARADVSWITHYGDADEAIAENSGVIAPRGGFAPSDHCAS